MFVFVLLSLAPAFAGGDSYEENDNAGDLPVDYGTCWECSIEFSTFGCAGPAHGTDHLVEATAFSKAECIEDLVGGVEARVSPWCVLEAYIEEDGGYVDVEATAGFVSSHLSSLSFDASLDTYGVCDDGSSETADPSGVDLSLP